MISGRSCCPPAMFFLISVKGESRAWYPDSAETGSSLLRVQCRYRSKQIILQTNNASSLNAAVCVCHLIKYLHKVGVNSTHATRSERYSTLSISYHVIIGLLHLEQTTSLYLHIDLCTWYGPPPSEEHICSRSGHALMGGPQVYYRPCDLQDPCFKSE